MLVGWEVFSGGVILCFRFGKGMQHAPWLPMLALILFLFEFYFLFWAGGASNLHKKKCSPSLALGPRATSNEFRGTPGVLGPMKKV